MVECVCVCGSFSACIYMVMVCECIACPKHRTNVVACFVRCVSMRECAFLFGYKISASEQDECMCVCVCVCATIKREQRAVMKIGTG